MRFAGIVAEYNPFHNGHVYQIEETRRAGATHIVVAMSGNMVQRGETACFSKWTRAEAAIRGGADLVIELPAVYACAPAERFANGAVALLSAFGQPGLLSFGSECGDLALLERAAEAIDRVDHTPELRAYLDRGYAFPNARRNAIADLCGEELAQIPSRANDMLAVEYIRAIRRQGGLLKPHAVPRVGPQHDGKKPLGRYASASRLREICQKCSVRLAAPFIPEEAYALYRRDYATGRAGASVYEAERMMLYYLRTLTIPQIAALADVNEGLEHRFYRAGREANNMTEAVARIASRRYPESRARHVLACGLLGLTKELTAMPPAYIRPLAFNQRGQALLKCAKAAKILPVIHSFAKLERAFPDFARPEYLATELFRMSLQKPLAELSEYSEHRPFCLTSPEEER